MALFGIMFKLSGVDYDDIADNALQAFVIPLAVVAVVLVIVTTLLGWWKPAIRDERRASGWIIAVPIVMLTVTILGINYGRLGDIDSTLLLWIAIGTFLIGFSEELMYRGLVLVGFRGAMKESHAWLWSSMAFGLLHGINAFLGQDLAPTIVQVV
jgi:membrane protease YdiL (CAAX protease family)